jgi:hypothetical protein
VPAPYTGELSLQTTLDRLGFTVNVPQEYQGRHLLNRGDGHVSTRSDALPSGWFEANGPVRFLELSRQSDLGSVTTVTAETDAGQKVELLPRVGSSYCETGARAGRTAARELRGTYRFSIDFPPNGYTQGPLFSTAADNPGGGSQLLVLPARRGGTWVDEGENLGHWEGGADENGCLLCWEDVVHGDNDFQDLVVYAEGVQPAQR